MKMKMMMMMMVLIVLIGLLGLAQPRFVGEVAELAQASLLRQRCGHRRRRLVVLVDISVLFV